MRSIRKIAALALAAVLLFALGACSKAEDYLVVDGKALHPEHVLTINGDEISLEEYRYYFMNVKYDYDKGDPAYWQTTADETPAIRQAALDYLLSNHSMLKIAEANGIVLEDTDRASAKETMEAAIKAFGSRAEYLSQLKQYYMTEDLYRQFCETDVIVMRLSEKLFGEGGAYALTDEQMNDLVHKEYIRATHILIGPDAEGETKNQELTEDLLKRIQNGEDFTVLQKEHNTDPGITADSDSYYFTRGQMVPAFEDAAYALQENEVSGIVKTDAGYHIIKRLPFDEEYLKANVPDMKYDHYNAILAEMIDAESARAECVFDESYDLITVFTLS